MYTPLIISLAASALTLPGSSHARTISRVSTNAIPIMNGINFPDPAVIRSPAGWHLFSTNAWSGPKGGSIPAPQTPPAGSKLVHIQRAFTSDWKTFDFHPGADAMPKLASWIAPSNPRVWGPGVNKLEDGTFIMYYTAASKANPSIHCLGFATAKKITDPFVDDSPTPWICPVGRGGAIDPAGYADETHGGKRWVVYKVDGNSIGHGGACGNTVKPIVATPIMLQEVGADGHTLIGSPTQILINGPADGPYVEAPSLTRMNGKFVLFFSSQCYTSAGYDVQYAVADKISGPYNRKGRLFGTGDLGLLAPGGLDVAVNGNHAIFHGSKGSTGQRPAYVAVLDMVNGKVTASLK